MQAGENIDNLVEQEYAKKFEARSPKTTGGFFGFSTAALDEMTG